MSSRTWWKVAQVAAVLPVLALLASCVQLVPQNNAALDRQVQSLEQRVAQLEQRGAGTDVEALRATLQALAAKVGQMGAPAALPPAFDEARVAAIVERSTRRLRAEFVDKMRAVAGFAGRASRGGQPRGGQPPARGRRPQPQKMTMEQIISRKTEQIAQRAGLGAEQAQALGKLMMAYRQGLEQIREKLKAKEITREEYHKAAREAHRKDLEAKEQFLADLDVNVNQREVLEKVLGMKRPGKREKKAGADKQRRWGKKKGRRAEEK